MFPMTNKALLIKSMWFFQETSFPVEIIVFMYVFTSFRATVSVQNGRKVDQLLVWHEPSLFCAGLFWILLNPHFLILDHSKRQQIQLMVRSITPHYLQTWVFLISGMDVWLSTPIRCICVSKAELSGNRDYTTRPNRPTVWPFQEKDHWLLRHHHQAKVSVEEKKYLASRTVAKTDYNLRTAVSTTHTH